MRISSSDMIISKIESNVDAMGVTPKLHREDLLKYVHPPKFRRLSYTAPFHYALLVDGELPSISSTSLVLRLLSVLHRSIDKITQISPSSQPSGVYINHLEHDIAQKMSEQVRKFTRRANTIYEELGGWSLDYFIRESIASLRNSDTIPLNFGKKSQIIKSKLLHSLERDILPFLEQNSSEEMVISSKVQQLINFLSQKDENECSGLIFVQQRVTVAVLLSLLSQHPATKSRFKCGTFVGLSNNASRRYDVDELLDLKVQQQTLTEFRARKKNLVIATDVLEEGIDVSACNLVICFDPPNNLKSFIQRRGRARQELSEYIIMSSEDNIKVKRWESLEQDMIKIYQDEERDMQHLRDKEEIDEEVDDIIRVKSTG
jgi:ERCC4-related helicase